MPSPETPAPDAGPTNDELHLGETAPGCAAVPRSIVAGVLLALAIHALMLWLLFTRRLDLLFNDASHRLGPGTDFLAYYRAGEHFVRGQGAYGHGPGFGFRYHPAFAATVGALLSRFSVDVAFVVWVGVQEVCYFVVWRRLRAFLEDDRAFLASSLLLATFTPYYLEVFMGNASFICGTLLLVACERLVRGRLGGFTAWWCLSILVKPVGLVLAPMLILRRQLVPVLATAAAVVLSAIPFFLADARAWEIFYAVNASGAPRAGWLVHAGNQGFHGLLTTVFARLSGYPLAELASTEQLGPFAHVVLSALPFLLVVVATAVTLKARHDVPLLVFVWSSVYLLGYKDIWEHSYSFAVVPLVFAHRARAVAPFTLLCLALLLALPTGFALYDPLPPGRIDPEGHWPDGISFLHHATKSVAFVAFFATVLARAVARRPAREDGGSPLGGAGA